jgi:hypothetical protein
MMPGDVVSVDDAAFDKGERAQIRYRLSGMQGLLSHADVVQVAVRRFLKRVERCRRFYFFHFKATLADTSSEMDECHISIYNRKNGSAVGDRGST